jgi:rhamnulokinase
MQEPARIAIDLGAESCRVSLLQWADGVPSIEVIHRKPNGPVHDRGNTLRWPLDSILAGLEEGLRKAALAAPEGIASIAVDSWGVDYVRLAPDGSALSDPFCYRDERTVPTKEAADRLLSNSTSALALCRCASTRFTSCWPTPPRGSMPTRLG